MAGCLRKADVSRDDRCEHLAGEVLAHLLSHLGGEVGAPVKHGQGYAKNLQPGIHTFFHHPQSAHKITETLQREVFALHRHQDSIGGAQAVQRQQFQGRGAVDENEVIFLLCPEQRLFQLTLPMLRPNQLHCRARKV